MTLKYQSYLQSIPSCPPRGYAAFEVTAYRFVKNDPVGGDDFQPVALMSPARKFHNDAMTCSAHGLSFFASEGAARKRYAELIKNIPNISKTIGNLLAHGTLKVNNGICCKPEESGHFTLHEFASSDLTVQFAVIDEL